MLMGPAPGPRGLKYKTAPRHTPSPARKAVKTRSSRGRRALIGPRSSGVPSMGAPGFDHTRTTIPPRSARSPQIGPIGVRHKRRRPGRPRPRTASPRAALGAADQATDIGEEPRLFRVRSPAGAEASLPLFHRAGFVTTPHATRKCVVFRHIGEVAEWLKAPHSKCGIRATVSGVRIPPSPPLPCIPLFPDVSFLLR
jgi:hypothetical protein